MRCCDGRDGEGADGVAEGWADGPDGQSEDGGEEHGWGCMVGWAVGGGVVECWGYWGGVVIKMRVWGLVREGAELVDCEGFEEVGAKRRYILYVAAEPHQGSDYLCRTTSLTGKSGSAMDG